jgi:hypothetical protein
VYSSKRWEGERERERKGSSALKERGSEKHKRRDPSAGKKAIKIVSLFFGSRIFFEISFFWEGWPKRKRRGGGWGGDGRERDAKKKLPPKHRRTQGTLTCKK